MLFNSLHFLFFFPIVVLFYFGLSPKYRTWFLLISSYYFYMCWKPEYALLIFLSTIIDFVAARQMVRSVTNKRKWLMLSLFSNLSILFLFKYFNFFSDTVHSVFSQINIFYEQPVFELLLPVGISFYTFQTLSYSIDVYKGKLEPENNFVRFALFVSFFPQLVAGPIERATHLLPQFRTVHKFDYTRVVSGLRYMLWGFFKKIVIADRLALLVDQVYNNPSDQNGITYLLATYLFAFQIYCDFSGYSDIAIGSARIMGYDLMENFRQPYLSRSIKEFWSRWHISLSTWFRDYVYIPLGGNRAVKWRWYYNLLITFLISGLWHGANWTFVLWGAFHGLLLLLGIILFSRKRSDAGLLKTLFQVFLVFHLVLISWIFFRSSNISQAATIFVDIMHLPSLISFYLQGGSVFLGLGQYRLSTVAYCILLVILLYMVDLFISSKRIKALYHRSITLRWITYFTLLYWIVFGGYFGETSFIYFQF